MIAIDMMHLFLSEKKIKKCFFFFEKSLMRIEFKYNLINIKKTF